MDLVTTFIPGVLLALLVRLDAKLIGPYFALSELVPGFPGFDAPLWTQRGALRFAVARRALYPFLLGCIFGLSGLSLHVAGVAGGMAAFLLLWPGFFMPRPWGVRQFEWRLILLHVSMVAAFAGFSALGVVVIGTMEALGDGDILKYIGENLFNWILTLVVTIASTAFTKGLFLSMKERSEDRRRQSYNPVSSTHDTAK